MGRKVGVGFNQLRVLRHLTDWRDYYDFMRRMTRLPRGTQRRPWWQGPVAASAVEMMRIMRRDR